MMTDVTVVTGTAEGFDYAALDMETRVVVQQRTGEIRSLVRRSAQDVIEIGAKLDEVKGRLVHGSFGTWLSAEFGWSVPTAYRFMQVASRFQNYQIDNFAPSALYLLAAPSTPDDAVEEALERAEGGERITHATAKAIVDEYRPAPAGSNGGLAVGSPEARRFAQDVKAATWGDHNAPAADVEKQRATWGDLTAIVREVAEANKPYVAAMRQAADMRSTHQRNKFYYDVLNAVRGRYYNRFDLADMCMAISTIADQMEAAQQPDELTAPDGLAGRWELQQSAAGFRMSDGYILTQPCATAEAAFELARRIEDEEERSEGVEENEVAAAPVVDLWVAAWEVRIPESFENRVRRLAAEILPWTQAWTDDKGRTWRDLLGRNPQHANSPFRQELDGECRRRGLVMAGGSLAAVIEEMFSQLTAASDNPLLSDDDEVVIEEPSIDEGEEETLPPVAEAYTGQPVVEESTPVSMRDGYDSDEWYTPAWVIEAAREVMGAIDLDPASCELAQEVVQAGLFWSKRQNGALMGWFGRVWLNPPYSEPKAFVDKLLQEYAHGNVRQAVVLLNNATETAWFQAMLSRFPVCFFSKRLAFWRHDHADVGARQGQAVFYLGQDVERFCEVFGQFGIVVKRLD